MAAMALGVSANRDDGSVETPGVVYDAQTIADLKKLRIGAASDLCEEGARSHSQRDERRRGACRPGWVEVLWTGAR